MVTLLVLLATTAADAGPWAEAPSLLEKATDPAFHAVASAEEILHRRFDDPSPRTDEYAPPRSDGWRWFGRSLPVLDPAPLGNLWYAGFGNEVGDYGFRESTVEETPDSDNRNPALGASISAPVARGVDAALAFDQVDHFSDRMKFVRRSLLGWPDFDGAPSRVRRAYFGENIPGHSFLAGSLVAQDRGSISARDGWIWLPSPGTGELQCWHATTASGTLRLGKASWSHAEGWMDRADTASGDARQSQGRISSGFVGDSAFAWRTGIAYGLTRTSAGAPWKPDGSLSAQPSLDLAFAAGNIRLAGAHQAGTDFFLFLDTIRAHADLGPAHVGLFASGRWTDRPDGSAPWTDSSTAGVVRMDSRALEQTYATGAEMALRLGSLAIAARSTPWWVVHPRAFAPDSFAIFSRVFDEEWIVRSGSERALDGVLWGWKSSLEADARVFDSVRLEATLRHDPVLGGPAGQTDLVPPEWAASAGLRYGHLSGFSIQPVVVWRDDAIVRHHSAEDWVVPSGFDANLWIHQSYFRERVVFSMAALNILAEDRIQVPNAGEDRFRILVRVSGRVF